ncbi:MAG: lipoate--protein ligase [Bacteroidales bacterium]|nr:lipoate--protein ligase [Bacteroidales bacterium]MDD4669643.1 lipoate--protein ligase [Bacteroidales bacterium]
MLCLIDKTTDPYWNLAAEEYLLTSFEEPVFRLWQNDKAVIVGKNQNTLAEIDSEFINRHKIPVVRRLTGGGAVFHDLGNINFTFIDRKIEEEDSGMMFRRFTSPIIDALNHLGINASLEGRNDLVIDGKKFSGNAICIHKGRILQHGTLLFSSSLNDLSGALQNRPEKFTDKAVKSNRSRVTNISEHLVRPMTVSEFLMFLKNHIGKSYTEYNYSPDDLKQIEALAESKYRLDSWNYGCSPKYSFSKCIKFPAGLVELYMNVEKGIITRIEIRGDYFFKAPTEEFCKYLTGVPHSKEKITDRLNTLAIDDYFSGINSEELIRLFV